MQATKPTPTNDSAAKNAALSRSIKEVAAIGRQYKEFATKAGRLADQQHLSAKDSKKLATTIVHATDAYKYGEKLGKIVLKEVLERSTTAERCIDKLLAKADTLVEQQHSTAEEEKELHNSAQSSGFGRKNSCT